MKKILKCLLLASAFLATSCEGMLDEEVFGKPTSEEMLSNAENVAKVVGQAMRRSHGFMTIGDTGALPRFQQTNV